MKRIAMMVLLIVVTAPAGAQVRRRAPTIAQPSSWVSLSAGIFDGNGVIDGATSSAWDFGAASTAQYRASLERAIGNTASIGAAATYVRVPFTYRGSASANSCAQCAAHLDMMSLGASFHVGGGIGFHQVLEGSAGALQYRNLQRDSDKSALAPTGGNVDPYFTFSYGFGWGFGTSTQLSVVQDFGLALHERTGLTSEQSNTLRQRTIRLNLRYGFGNRNSLR